MNLRECNVSGSGKEDCESVYVFSQLLLWLRICCLSRVGATEVYDGVGVREVTFRCVFGGSDRFTGLKESLPPARRLLPGIMSWGGPKVSLRIGVDVREVSGLYSGPMSENEERTVPTPKDENEVWEAIFAFEQILDVMPDDRSSLEALIHAYAHVGDQVKAQEYLVRYGHVLVNQGDHEAARELSEQLGPLRGDANVSALLDRLEMLLGAQSTDDMIIGGGESVEDAAPAEPVEEALTWGDVFEVSDELQLAWQLFDSGEMSQDDYATVVQDLSDMASASSEVTVSVFHVLDARTSKALGKLLGYVAQDAPAPLVSLECFEAPLATIDQIPRSFMLRHGVMLFDQLGEEGMLVMMNPYNTRLRDYVQNHLGMTCHVYTCEPQEFDGALSRLAHRATEAAEPPPADAG
jgi:hypothetical protein